MFDKIENNALKRRVKNHVIGREHDFFAVVQPGFEKRAACELTEIGLDVRDNFIEGGVEFKGRIESCYTASLLSRTAGRIMTRIAGFRASNFYELERHIRSFPWELYISEGTEIKFRSSTEKSMIFHTGKLEEIFTLCIGERLSSCCINLSPGEGASVQTLFLRNSHDMCMVSLDASGEFLYKRGEGKKTGPAPLRETTAALILHEAGLKIYSQIIDPMCGSGTFSLESAGILTKTPPALRREFPFSGWPCFREKTYNFIYNTALKNIIPQESITQKIITSDIEETAVKTTVSNIPGNFSKIINPEKADFFSMNGDIVRNKRTLIVLNPPYGKRISGHDSLVYREIGKKINKDFSLCGYAIIVPGHEYENILGLDYDRKIPFINGGIKAAVIFKDADC